MTLMLIWQPIASPLHIAGGAAALAALAVFAGARVFAARPRAAAVLLVMRLAVIAAVSTLLMGPSREEPRPAETQRPRLAVLLDTSESMATEDCGSGSRLAHVTGEILTQERLQRLEQMFRVDVQGFDERVHPVAIGPLYDDPTGMARGRSTHLAEAAASTLGQMSRSSQGDAVLLISDGRDSEDAAIQPAAALARARQIPVFTVAVGGSELTTDAAILAVPLQESLLPGEPGAILVKVYQSGLNGRRTTIRLTHGDETTQFPIDFGDKSMVDVQIPVSQDEAGQYEYEVSIDPIGDETELSNNKQIVFCEVMKRRIRVLILEGQPFWDTKFLAQSLRKDERIELTQITQVGAEKRETIVSRSDGASTGVPASSEDWSAYDVVVLGRGMEHVLDRAAAERLVQFVVEGGGQLILARGQAYDPATPAGSELQAALAVIEPVVWGQHELQELQIELTPSGHGSPWLSPLNMGTDAQDALSRLGGFETMRSVEREKPGTLVLARAQIDALPGSEGVPAVTRMQYGKGTIVALLGEGTWRWSLLPPETQDLRGFYDTFWSNLVRWMALGGDFPPGQQVALQLSRTTARLGDELTVDLAYKHDPADGRAPRLQLVGPDGTAAEVGLNELPGAFPRYRATITPTTTGVFRLTASTPGMNPSEIARDFNVYDVNLERLQTAVNPMPLQILAEHSGGAFLTTETIDNLLIQLERHLASLAMPSRLEYLWDRGSILALLLLWMGVEWIGRRLAGLW